MNREGVGWPPRSARAIAGNGNGKTAPLGWLAMNRGKRFEILIENGRGYRHDGAGSLTSGKRPINHKVEKPIFMRLRGPKALDDEGTQRKNSAESYDHLGFAMAPVTQDPVLLAMHASLRSCIIKAVSISRQT